LDQPQVFRKLLGLVIVFVQDFDTHTLSVNLQAADLDSVSSSLKCFFWEEDGLPTLKTHLTGCEVLDTLKRTSKPNFRTDHTPLARHVQLSNEFHWPVLDPACANQPQQR
jgi:hypothetical protein